MADTPASVAQLRQEYETLQRKLKEKTAQVQKHLASLRVRLENLKLQEREWESKLEACRKRNAPAHEQLELALQLRLVAVGREMALLLEQAYRDGNLELIDRLPETAEYQLGQLELRLVQAYRFVLQLAPILDGLQIVVGEAPPPPPRPAKPFTTKAPAPPPLPAWVAPMKQRASEDPKLMQAIQLLRQRYGETRHEVAMLWDRYIGEDPEQRSDAAGRLAHLERLQYRKIWGSIYNLTNALTILKSDPDLGKLLAPFFGARDAAGTATPSGSAEGPPQQKKATTDPLTRSPTGGTPGEKSLTDRLKGFLKK